MQASTNKRRSIQQAGQCLKDVESCILYSSHSDDWRGMRDDFLSTIDQANDVSDVGILLEQLRRFEYNLKYSKQTDSWKQWERKYWRVMTDPNINVRKIIPRFIITLKFMERSILREAHGDTWMETERDEWLEKCNALVDPLLEDVSFYDEMYLNVDAMLEEFGYNSLQEYGRAACKVISTINSAADKLDQVATGTGIADATAGGLGITSGLFTGAGICLAPFTAGLSLALTGTGIALGVGSATTAITSNVVQIIWDEKKAKEVQEATQSITAETMALMKLLESYAGAVNDLKEKLNLLGDLRALEYLKKAGLTSYTIYKGITKTHETLNVARMLRIIEEIRPNLIAEGLGIRVAQRVAVPELRIQGNLAIGGANALGAAAAALSGILSALSVVFGILETMNGAEKIIEGSALAKKFRDLTKNLVSAKKQILQSYGRGRQPF